MNDIRERALLRLSRAEWLDSRAELDENENGSLALRPTPSGQNKLALLAALLGELEVKGLMLLEADELFFLRQFVSQYIPKDFSGAPIFLDLPPKESPPKGAWDHPKR